MKNSGRSYIFDNLIRNYQEHNIQYTFLRKNDIEKLDHTEDLDIVIGESNVILNDKIINEITGSDKFLAIKNFIFNDNIIYTIFINEVNFVDVLHIHFQVNLRIKQITIAPNNSIYLSNEVMMNNYKNIDGLNILNDEYYLYSIVVHSVFDKGYFKEDYKCIIEDYVNRVSKGQLAKVFDCNFPGFFPSDALELIYNRNYEELINSKDNLFKLNVGFRTKLMFFQNNMRRFVQNISRLWANKGVFIVLLGPDGSGKTTVSKKFVENINCSRKSYLYLGSNKKRMIPRPNINKKNSKRLSGFSNEFSRKPRFRIRKLIREHLRLIYNASEYILYYYLKVFPLLLKDYLVVGDRYFYDVLALKDSTLKPIEEKIILQFIPSPSCTILLDNDPEIIKARKDESELEEINRLLLKYKDLGRQNPKINMYEIRNENLESTVEKLIVLFWKKKVNK